MLLRLAFAIATDVESQILVIDEVFSIGDAEFRQRASQRLDRLITDSKIVLMVSHDLDLVREICTRVVCIEEGRIVDDGAPETVCGAYLARKTSG